ncbi:MAG TPA: RDD family protein [Streptosporangiaceae bacterium]|jgi:uncharacterized RDD family membrane protein YckC|nr:RDD family protein [Streptosporangiaceae bacterium]
MAYAASEPVAAPYANWFQRVGAYLIDAVLPAVIYLIAILTHTGIIVALGFLIAIGFTAYNRWYLAGTTGQSWGNKALGLSLIGEATGQPIGFFMAFVRDVCHILDSLACYIGWLWPLWDPKRQTFADKIIHTVVVNV